MPGDEVRRPRPQRPTATESGDRLRWLFDADLQQQRLRDQVAMMTENRPDIEVITDTDGRPVLIHAAGILLVREADLGAVSEAIRDDRDKSRRFEVEESRPIVGLARCRVADVLDTLQFLEERLGRGIASPDHVVYLTGGPIKNPTTVKAGCCPATEPQVVAGEPPAFVPPLNNDPETSGAGVKVLVVDTGFLPDVAAQHAPLLDGVTGDVELCDPSNIGEYVGHGTFIAGIIRCLAPRTEIVVKGFLTKGGEILESELTNALELAIEQTPDIISLSAGATTYRNLPLLSFQTLWEERLRHLKGTVILAAAGNDGNRGPFWPAAFPWAISVGALDSSETGRAAYSDFGSWVDVHTRGSDIVNVYPTGTYVYKEGQAKADGKVATFTNGFASWSGTSFSTPVFAGMIAGRMSKTGESARDAAAALMAVAHTQSQPQIGPLLHLL